jgi:hypothetical protein
MYMYISRFGMLQQEQSGNPEMKFEMSLLTCRTLTLCDRRFVFIRDVTSALCRKKETFEVLILGVDVMIEIFADFRRKNGFFLKNQML